MQASFSTFEIYPTGAMMDLEDSFIRVKSTCVRLKYRCEGDNS